MTSLSDRAGFLIIANFIKYAVAFVMPMVLVRMLSQTDYGTYQQLSLVSTTAIGVMTLGLPTSIYYFYHNIHPTKLPALFVQTSIVLALSGLAVTIAVFFGAETLARLLNNPPLAGLLGLAAFSLVFLIASEHSLHFLIAQNRYGLAVGFETGETVIRVLLLLTPLLLGFGLYGLVVSFVVYAVLRFSFRITYLFRANDLKFAGWSHSTFLADQFSYSIPLLLVSLTALIGSTFNRGILASSFTPADYAVYVVGDFPFPLAAIFQASVANVLRASLPPLVRDGNLVEVVRVIREAVRKLSIIVLPSFIFLLGFSYEFITVLYTTKYEQSVSVFRIFVWEVPLDMFVLSPIPQLFGKTRANLYAVLVSTSILLLLSYGLLHLIGFYGPAIASVTAQYLLVAIFVWVGLRLTKTTLRELMPMRHILRVILIALFALLLAKSLSFLIPAGLANLIVAGIIFSATFLATAAWTDVLNQQDRQLIRRWLDKIPAVKHLTSRF